ncbi:hypothetical protein AbraIFM66951_000800 [Aspergillus brasiliensis]|nr:hypothetical protein AbraIFM66951_000800 [Aspergillus brasiliensis]
MTSAYKSDLALRYLCVKVHSLRTSSRLTNGKPLDANESLKRGLIDKIGHIETVFKIIEDQELLRVVKTADFREKRGLGARPFVY